MAVDTYLEGKNTSKYRKVNQSDVEVLISPTLERFAQEVHLVTRKGLLKRKLIAVIYRDPDKCVL